MNSHWLLFVNIKFRMLNDSNINLFETWESINWYLYRWNVRLRLVIYPFLSQPQHNEKNGFIFFS